MILFVLVCVACTTLVYKKEKSIVNPVTVFVSVWLLAVCLASLRLSRWHDGIDGKTYLLLSLVIVAFSAAYVATRRLILSKYRPSSSDGCLSVDKRLVKALLMVWVAFAVVEVVYSGGFPLLWHVQGLDKTYFDFGIPSLHGLMNSVGLVIILLCFYNVCAGGEKKRENIGIIIALLAYYILLLTRQVVISAVLEMAVVAFMMRNKRWSPGKITVLLLFSILAFGILGNVRTGYSEFMHVAQMRFDIPKPLVGFYWVYMYLSMTIANLNNLIIGNTEFVGLSAFSGVIPSVFAPILNLDTGFYSADFLVTPAFNVSGFFVNAYLGFGMMGAIVYSSIYGMVSSIASTRLRQSVNEINILVYAVAVQVVALSFFDDMLLYLPCSFQVVILFVLAFLSKKLK